ncbi:DUF3592 domain-containing protein [Alienimonas chondri]|uniref:DUF3592 domain-containing protein n=1 Tax=Alienimonas chondri TaxID=2681879 RepID=A0ABX1VAB0_9PLAN|nr:DUF3592 domain-containing protein [Alienimonas chondri]NNJ24851.1 hypothetical protein [Alienimonas chondri]
MTERESNDPQSLESVPPAGRGDWRQFAIVAFWLLGWAIFLIAFAVGVLPNYRLAVRSLGFAETLGRVIDCRVIAHPGGDNGPTYSLDLSYAYQVGGRKYLGARYDANSPKSGDRDWYRRRAEALRPNTVVTVHYDPADPKNSLLAPGVTGTQLFAALFAVPFAAMLAVAVRFLRIRIQQSRASTGAAEPPPTVHDGRLIRAPLAPYPPFVAGAIGAGGVALIEVFAISFTYGSRPPLWVPATALLIAAAAGIGGAVGVTRRRATGVYDLVIDPDQELLALPMSLGRRKRLAVPFAGVERVGIDKRTDSEGSTYAAAVFLTDQAAADLGAKRTQALTVHYGPSPRCPRRDGLIRWLRGHLGRPIDEGFGDEAT